MMISTDWTLPWALTLLQLIFGILAYILPFTLLLMTALAEMSVSPK